MKITSKDILNGLKLQKGDNIIIGKDVKAKVLNDETIELTETNVLCPVTQLINREVTKVENPNRKAGDRRCNEIPSCTICPLGILNCGSLEDGTLFEYVESLKSDVDAVDERKHKIFKEVLNKPI